MNPNDLYLFDEPEAALSPQRQLTLLMQIYRCAKEGAQFIIVTHSPILLGIPDAEISKSLLLTTVKHALSVSLYEGIIFLSYFKKQRIKKCQKKDVIQFKSYRKS